MEFSTFAIFGVGIVLLVVGAEIFVRGASKLALLLGISPLVIGLTVVAYGTSMPELAVSVQSSWAGAANITLGNVVGSNIANVLLILGLSALASPLIVSQAVVRLDVPIMITVSLLVFFFGWYGQIVWWEGVLLFVGAVAYTAFQVIQSRRERSAAVQAEYAAEYGRPITPSSTAWLLIGVQIVGGIGLLVLGSRFLVDAAVAIASSLGVSDLVIGLTVVAVGTSLPELATSVVASLRGERDIAVGNVVGSNIFNILTVLGLSALVSSGGVAVTADALWFDIPVMIGVAATCLPIFLTGRLPRWVGALFLAYYAAYIYYLILRAGASPLIVPVGRLMLEIIIPLTIVWISATGIRAWRQMHTQAAS